MPQMKMLGARVALAKAAEFGHRGTGSAGVKWPHALTVSQLLQWH